MDESYWWLLVFGTVFSVAVTGVFIYALFLGLRKRVWWPLFMVLCLWLAGMVAYSGWDGEQRRENARRRAEQLSLLGPVSGLLPCAEPGNYGAIHPLTPASTIDGNPPWPT